MKIFKFISPTLFLIPILLITSSNAVSAQSDVNVTGVVDNENPIINIIAPPDGATISGNEVVNITVTDDGGIVKVEFFVDGLLKLTDTSSPFEFNLDTRTVSNGSHTISATATDIAGKTNTDTITVIIDNPTLKSPSKKLTPIGQPTVVTGGKPSETPEESPDKFFIRIPFGFGDVVKAPYDFVTANTNFFYGFLFALELLIVFFLIKKIRERKKKEKNQQGNTPTAPPSPPKTNLFKS